MNRPVISSGMSSIGIVCSMTDGISLERKSASGDFADRSARNDDRTSPALASTRTSSAGSLALAAPSTPVTTSPRGPNETRTPGTGRPDPSRANAMTEPSAEARCRLVTRRGSFGRSTRAVRVILPPSSNFGAVNVEEKEPSPLTVGAETLPWGAIRLGTAPRSTLPPPSLTVIPRRTSDTPSAITRVLSAVISTRAGKPGTTSTVDDAVIDPSTAVSFTRPETAGTVSNAA